MAGGLTSCAFLGLARVTAVMTAAGQGDFIRPPLLALGLASMLVGAGLMLGQVDLKRLLAYSSVEHMGILAIALGIGGVGSYGAALHVINNGVAKVLLFLTVANLVLWFGSAETTRLRSVLRRAPISGSVLVLGLFAVTGSPPFGLFVSEFAILGAAVQQDLVWVALAMLLLLAVVFVGMAGAILAVVHRETGAPGERVRESPWLVGGTVFLTALALLLGLYLPMPLRALLADAARVLGGSVP